MKNNVSVYVDKENMRPYYRVEISLPIEELEDMKAAKLSLSSAIGDIVLAEIEESKKSPPVIFQTDRIERLERDCAEAYQILGSFLLEGEDSITYENSDITRALDNLDAAVNNTPRPHEDLLPWPKK